MWDATASALTDLLDYWVHAGNSISPDEDRNYRYAVRRGEWMGVQFLGQFLASSADLDSLDDIEPDGQPHLHRYIAADDVEELVVEDHVRQRVLRLVDELPSTKADWLKSYLAGVTTREEAQEQGVSQPAIVQRRARLLEELRESARRSGVLG